MGDLEAYKENCEYIRKEFELNELSSLYQLVNKITEAYRTIKAQNELEKIKSTIVEPSKKGKKRGRPRKTK